MKYKTVENPVLENIWNNLKTKAKLSLPGKLYLLDANENIFQLFPTGDLFISTKTIESLSNYSIEALLAHELGHMKLHHAQESINYTKITSIVSAWLCKHNHHMTTKLKFYLLNPKYNSLQEAEANEYAKEFVENFKNFNCEKSLN